MKKNDNMLLIIGMAIPVLMIIFVGISVYLPAMLVQPKGSFLYALGGDYYSNNYSVENGKVVKNEVRYPPNYIAPVVKSESKFYIYDIAKNTSREISFEDAQKLKLNPSNISPDGFELTSGSTDYSIFSVFFLQGDYYRAKYIQGRGVSKRLNLQKEGDNYWNYGNFRFIGWLIQ